MDKSEATDCVIDTETLSLSPNAAVVSIGAVLLNLNDETVGHTIFYTNIDIGSSLMNGGHVDADTLQWWRKPHMRSAWQRLMFSPNPVAIDIALIDFSRFINPDVRMWGRGPDFDNVILSETYKRAGIPLPWKFRNNRCSRTLHGLKPNVVIDSSSMMKHYALDDALWQARILQSVVRELKSADPNFRIS